MGKNLKFQWGVVVMANNTFNLSDLIIEATGYPGAINRATGKYEPFYTRPDGQNLEQLAYTDQQWVKQAQQQFNQPNNVKSVIITKQFIVVNYFYQPVGTKGKINTKKYNIPDGSKVTDLFKWIDKPRIHQNIEEILISDDIIRMLRLSANNIKRDMSQHLNSQDMPRLKHIQIANDMQIQAQIKEIATGSQIYETLKNLGIQVIQMYNNPNTSQDMVTRTEFYKFDTLIRQKDTHDKHIADTSKKSKLEEIFEDLREQFGDEVAQRMARVAVQEQIKKAGQVFQPDKIKNEMLAEMQRTGRAEFQKYIL